jgi:hypothetical protein
MRTPESDILVYRFEALNWVKLLDDVKDWIFDNGNLIIYDIVIRPDSKEVPYLTALVYVMA